MGFPKALARLGNRTFLERIVACIGEAGIGEWRVVAGRHAEEIASRVAPERLVINPDYAGGMTTSFQAGIRSLPPGVSRLAVFLVDHPLVSASTVRRLLGRAGEGDVLVPTYRGRRGHPVVFSAAFMAEILDLSPERGVRSLIRERGRGVVEVPVEDPGILTDVDTPGELRKIGGRFPS